MKDEIIEDRYYILLGRMLALALCFLCDVDNIQQEVLSIVCHNKE